jgi:hypothetical protein
MMATPERSLRFVDSREQRARSIDHWRTRSAAERLHAVLALHREGNALFKGGNPPFARQWKLTDVRAG